MNKTDRWTTADWILRVFIPAAIVILMILAVVCE